VLHSLRVINATAGAATVRHAAGIAGNARRPGVGREWSWAD